MIDGVSDLKSVILEEVKKLFEPDEVRDFELTFSDFQPKAVIAEFSITVRTGGSDRRKLFRGKVDRETGQLEGIKLRFG